MFALGSGQNRRLRAAWAGVLCLALVLALAGCVPPPSAGVTMTPYEKLMGQAETSALVGDRDAAIATYKRAANINPAAAGPWIELAQLYFDSDDYGRAIIAAREGSKRETGGQRADSIMTISGLRVAFDALARLRTQAGMNGTVRQEAVRVAQLLRNMLGEKTLIVEDSVAEEDAQRRVPSSASATDDAETPVETPAKRVYKTTSGADSTVDPVRLSNPFSALKKLSGQ